MLTNKQIRELLRKNRNDFTKFRKFLDLTHQGLEYRLKDET